MTYSSFDYSCVTDKMSLCMDKIIENRLKPLKFNNSQYFSEAELKERRESKKGQHHPPQKRTPTKHHEVCEDQKRSRG